LNNFWLTAVVVKLWYAIGEVLHDGRRIGLLSVFLNKKIYSQL